MNKELNKTQTVLTMANLNLTAMEKRVLQATIIDSTSLLMEAVRNETSLGVFRVLDAIRSRSLTILRKNNALPASPDCTKLLKNQYDMYLGVLHADILGVMAMSMMGYPITIEEIHVGAESDDVMTITYRYYTHLAVSDNDPGAIYH